MEMMVDRRRNHLVGRLISDDYGDTNIEVAACR